MSAAHTPPMAASFASPGQLRASQQVCDNCRFRKTKCDRGLPCSSCVASSIRCQYLHTLRRKGPRGGKGRRLLQIRQGLTQLDKDHIEVSTPAQLQLEHVAAAAADEPSRSSVHAPTSSSAAVTEHESSKHRLAVALAANVQVFFKHLFPIMPVLNDAEVLADALQFDELPLPRQAFLLSLCAATRIQLKLDHVEECDDLHASVNAHLGSPLTGEGLLSAAKRLRRQFDIVDNRGLDAVLTSFFLFAAHGNLEQRHHAWFYLNESMTVAFSLGLDNEATYLSLAKSERELRRRIFWLLFVTERTYALQHRRPVMLRSTITKPQVVDSDCPVVMHDFVNHIRLFELLPHSLYDWLPTSDPSQQQGSSIVLSQRVGDKLCAVQAADSVLESQRFDTLVTQQWLRVAMWRLAYGVNPSLMYGHAASPSLVVPFEAGKTIMMQLDMVNQTSKDCHGIGMEQKLFDIGISLADASMATFPTSSFEFGSLDLLSSIVKCLGRIRGGRSHLLPELLKHSEGVLACTSPAAQIDMQWALGDESSGSDPDSVADGAAMQLEDAPPPPGQDACTLSQFGAVGAFMPASCDKLGFDEVAAGELA
ncbi:hypothetical protein JDV02_008341 [Purpureocillium takamizusanense]|uniref:Zn(2)-C6 fungal-type domain-containing protein n=1 Tax=Purpureocillium takamizusanense TaxID=2060973 RepID=A0A9Q8QNG7_9HYPO|nr:uncharacterized protein JDV02_008341 [Purpureocillium takamizusanense]UNI22452.1 hypothetical protein JDV02_008341 [Purpureocillium takamizusanense]